MPFTEDFLKKDELGLKHYCKAYGLMFTNNDFIDITVKPLKQDQQYYQTIDNDNMHIYKVNDLIKIEYKKL